MISGRTSIGRMDYLATKYFGKRMKLSNRNSNTYVGCLVSMFWQEIYLNKEILWFSPLSRVLVCTSVYEAFFFFLWLYLNYAFWFNVSFYLLSPSSRNFHEDRSPVKEWKQMANKVNHNHTYVTRALISLRPYGNVSCFPKIFRVHGSMHLESRNHSSM